MKIVAGMGCIDDYIRLVQAGADEVFCGYVPYKWNKKYGTLFPINRREVLYYNTQINSLSEMRILKRMVDVYKVPVTITFNYLYYVEEQFEMIEEIIKELIEIGFNEFIIADIALVLYLREKNIKCIIHLSGECSEINRLSIDFLNKLDISRYIFHRKNSIEDMESCISTNKVEKLEYEAFILNERCHFTGAFCSSLHCDEMDHLCKIPYEMAKIDEKSNRFPNVDNNFKLYYEEVYYKEEENNKVYGDLDDEVNECYKVGVSGCGLCALKRLQKAGVTHLKVVGRGNFIDNMEKDIEGLKEAISLIRVSENDDGYEKLVKSKLFEGNCSGECYY